MTDLKTVAWGSRGINLRKVGSEWIGPTGEDGVLLVVRPATGPGNAGRFRASVEVRETGNAIHGRTCFSIDPAVASVLREVKRLGRASGRLR